MKTTGVSCETKFGLLGFLGHPSLYLNFHSLTKQPMHANTFPLVLQCNHIVIFITTTIFWGALVQQFLQLRKYSTNRKVNFHYTMVPQTSQLIICIRNPGNRENQCCCELVPSSIYQKKSCKFLELSVTKGLSQPCSVVFPFDVVHHPKLQPLQRGGPIQESQL